MSEGEKPALKPGETISIPAGPFKVTDLKPVTAPEAYATNVQIFANSNDFTLIFQRPMPVSLPGVPAESSIGGVMSPSVILHLSPGTVKDLMVVLQGLVADHEKEWGKLETAFTRKREAEAKAAIAKKQ